MGRRQRREMRLQFGEALTSGGLIMLVATPLVYRVHAASKHVRATRSMLWPTPLMVIPLLALVVGVSVMIATSNVVAHRRKPPGEARAHAVRTAEPPAA